MSWMVLSSALALSHELGSFEENQSRRRDMPTTPDAEEYLRHVDLRCRRLPSLLFVFINALSSRLGCTSPMPPNSHVPTLDLTILQDMENGKEWFQFVQAWTKVTKMTFSITEGLFPLMNSALANGSTHAFLNILEEKQIQLAEWHRSHLPLMGISLFLHLYFWHLY